MKIILKYEVRPSFVDFSKVERKQRLMMFAALIIVSGLLCFILEKQWFVGLGPLSKVRRILQIFSFVGYKSKSSV